MIKCPKCGFEQPKDQYCAKCGVDMENFKPISPPLFRRVFINPLFHITLFILCVLIGASYIKQQEKKEIQRRVEFLSGYDNQSSNKEVNTVALEAETLSAGVKNNTQNSVVESQASANPTPSLPQSATLQTSTIEEQKAHTVSVAKETPQAKESSETPKVRVYYAEVSNRYLSKLVEESQATGQFVVFGEFSSGLLPQIRQKLSEKESEKSVRILQKVEKQFEIPRAPLQWFLGVKDQESEIELGLSTHVAITELDQRSIKGEIEVLRTLRDGIDGQIVKRPFPASFEISKNYGFFMSGVLPHRNISDSEEYLFNTGILKILNSVPFQNKETEFVIFVEFER